MILLLIPLLPDPMTTLPSLISNQFQVTQQKIAEMIMMETETINGANMSKVFFLSSANTFAKAPALQN